MLSIITLWGETELIARIKDLAERNGLDARRLLGVNTQSAAEAIEAEYEVVNGDGAGLPE
jgi:hypothetical protein